eukprot:14716695-Alexandrium_andersonii.AAC.1
MCIRDRPLAAWTAAAPEPERPACPPRRGALGALQAAQLDPRTHGRPGSAAAWVHASASRDCC